MSEVEKVLEELSNFINNDIGTTFMTLDAVWPGSGDSPYFTVKINNYGASSTSIASAVREAIYMAVTAKPTDVVIQ